MGLTKPKVAPQTTRIDHYSRYGVSMTQTMTSAVGDTPLYSYIDMTASHPTALSLSYTMHPPYVTGQVSRRTSQNTLSPSWATPEARSATTPPLPDAELSSARSGYPGHYPEAVGNSSSTSPTNRLPRSSLSIRRLTLLEP